MLIHSNDRTPWAGEAIGGIRHPSDIEEKWTAAELAAIGLEKIETQKPVATSRRVGTFSEFMGLFTSAEQTTIAGAAMQSVPIKLWYDQAVAQNWIDLDSQKVKDGMAALVGAGLITSARSTEVQNADYLT